MAKKTNSKFSLSKLVLQAATKIAALFLGSESIRNRLLRLVARGTLTVISGPTHLYLLVPPVGNAPGLLTLVCTGTLNMKVLVCIYGQDGQEARL
jgi:hypothetical protein